MKELYMTPNPYWYENPTMSEYIKEIPYDCVFSCSTLKDVKTNPGDFVSQEDVQFCANNVEKCEIKGEGMTIDYSAFEAISDWAQHVDVDEQKMTVTKTYQHNNVRISNTLYYNDTQLIAENWESNLEVIKEGIDMLASELYLYLNSCNPIPVIGAIALNEKIKKNKSASNDMTESELELSLINQNWSYSFDEGLSVNSHRYSYENKWIQKDTSVHVGQDGNARTLPTYSSNFDVMRDDQSFLGNCKVADSSVYKRIDNYQHGETALFDHLENLNNKNLSLVAPICNPYKR